MIIYPAIDIKGGRVVRLFEGDRTQETVYADDPVLQAERFIAEGATWLHVVDMDLAFRTGGDNTPLVTRIAGLAGAQVQVGGLLHTPEQVDRALSTGAARAVVSTAGALEPGMLERLARQCGAARLAVALDTVDGRLVRRGSNQPALRAVAEIAEDVDAAGIATIIYRDLERDGTLAGFAVAGARGLLAAGRHIIVSGGGAALADVAAARSAGLSGAILGRALYEGRFTVREAIACSG